MIYVPRLRSAASGQPPRMWNWIGRLVEIATRALSPGINDLFTAIAVVDRLGAVLETILAHRLNPRVLCDDAGAARVVANRSDHSGIFNAAFNSIRRAAASHPEILIRIADTLAKLAPLVDTPPARSAALIQLAKLTETTRLGTFTEADRVDTLARIEAARVAISGPNRARAAQTLHTLGKARRTSPPALPSA